MDSLRILVLLAPLLFVSCAKTKYLFEQGAGQVSLLWNAKENEQVLKDPNVSDDIKDKIGKINKYKRYFYNYWDQSPSDIYSKTTLLENEAVTYLVISSPYNQIKPLKECFPFMGCFPYIGFFYLDSAKEYAKDRQEEGFETYIRPVYAYSTLGYFTDTILSSFFIYDEFELAELVFHELFHTIFFIKDEVDLNENLANYFSKKMVGDTFAGNSEFLEHNQQMQKRKALRKELVNLVNELQKIYETAGAQKLTREVAGEKREEFLKDHFFPRVKQQCEELQLKECYPLNRKWNNASFAAFMTYEKKNNQLDKLQKKLNLDLKSFYRYIEQEYKVFKKERPVKKFSEYLFRTI